MWSSCTSLHDPTWDIEPRPTKEVTHIKGHLRPEEKRADQLAPKEISELKVEHPEAFLPALPATDEAPQLNHKEVNYGKVLQLVLPASNDSVDAWSLALRLCQNGLST